MAEPNTGWQPGYVTITLTEDQALWMLDDEAQFPIEQQNQMAEAVVQAVRLAARQRFISAEALRHQMLENMHQVLTAEREQMARLEAWKAEAVEVLGQWEQVWEAAGRPGPLGGSKAEAVARMLTERTP